MRGPANAQCASPRFIKSCSIRNGSQDNIQVRVTYGQIGFEAEGEAPHQQESSLSQGETYRAEPRIVTHNDCQFNSQIQRVEATLADGRQFQLEHPFSGVLSIKNEWHFTVNDNGIESLPFDN